VCGCAVQGAGPILQSARCMCGWELRVYSSAHARVTPLCARKAPPPTQTVTHLARVQLRDHDLWLPLDLLKGQQGGALRQACQLAHQAIQVTDLDREWRRRRGGGGDDSYLRCAWASLGPPHQLYVRYVQVQPDIHCTAHHQLHCTHQTQLYEEPYALLHSASLCTCHCTQNMSQQQSASP
jgi:hypothetical protein